jgi:sugar phosphate isomerase/epimerase
MTNTTTAPVWNFSGFADEAGLPCDDQIAALQKAGMKFIDVRGVDGFNVSELPAASAEIVRKKLDAAGIKVAMLGSPLGKINLPDDFEIDAKKLRHMASISKILGCNAVRIFSYYNKDNAAPASTWRAEALSRLTKLKDIAGETGMVLYHENERHIFGEGVDNVLEIIHKLRDHKPGKPGVFRAIFDFDNYNQAGEDVWQNWLKLRDFTDAFHFKDSLKIGPGKYQHCPLGHGNGYAKEILADAVVRGINGPVSLEPHLKHSPAVMATGPSGVPNQKLSDMTPQEVFVVAANAARDLVTSVGGTLA